MFQRLLTALAQVKACTIPVDLLNEIGKIFYPLYQAKDITKEEHNNKIDLI